MYKYSVEITRIFLSKQRVQTALAEAQSSVSNASSDKEKAIAKIEVEVYEALQHALTK